MNPTPALPPSTATATPMPPTLPATLTTPLFGLTIQRQRFSEARASLMAVAASRGQPSRVVVTPNVDHIVRLESTPEFKALYATADYIYADGMPLVWVSRGGKAALPERVTGADLFVALCKDCITENRSIFVLGGLPGQEQALLQGFANSYPRLRVSIFCPSMQFTPDGAEADLAIEKITQAQAAIVFICLGMPKQEQFAFRYRREQTQNNAPLLLCVGAAMEFALGQKRRAPLWMQGIGMEWLWRLASEPRRLWQRYTVQGMKFFPIALRQWRAQKTN